MKRRIIGAALIIVGAFTALNGWAVLGWTMSYWDHEFVEAYRGYDIHYFPGIVLYGIDTGGDPQTWSFASSVEKCRAKIDNWLNEAIFIEPYLGYDIYQQPSGTKLYYAVKDNVQVVINSNLEALKAYLDDLAGTHTHETGLEGRWWVNDIEITDPDQLVILDTVTFAFRFKPTEGTVSSVTVSWTGPESGSKSLNKQLLGSSWKGTTTLSEGEYEITLRAEGPDGTLNLSLVGQVAGGAPPYTRWAVGAAISVVGVALLATKPRKKE